MKETHDLLTLPRGSGQVTDMAWSADGKKLAVVTDRGWLLVWYVRTGFRFVSFKLSPKRLLCLAWNRRGRALAVGDGSGALYRVSRLSRPVVHVHAFPEPVRRIAWSLSPVGRCLIVAGEELILMEESGTETHVQYASGILDAAWSADGRTLAVVCADGLVEVVNAEQQDRRVPVEGIPAPQCVSWRKDGYQLAIGTEQGYVHLCDPLAHEVRETIYCTRFPIHTLEWGSEGLILQNAQGDLTFVQEQDVLPLALRPTPTFALNVAGTQLAIVQRGKVQIAAF